MVIHQGLKVLFNFLSQFWFDAFLRGYLFEAFYLWQMVRIGGLCAAVLQGFKLILCLCLELIEEEREEACELLVAALWLIFLRRQERRLLREGLILNRCLLGLMYRLLLKSWNGQKRRLLLLILLYWWSYWLLRRYDTSQLLVHIWLRR